MCCLRSGGTTPSIAVLIVIETGSEPTGLLINLIWLCGVGGRRTSCGAPYCLRGDVVNYHPNPKEKYFKRAYNMLLR